MKHQLPHELRRRVVTIDLAGVGGTGSLLLPELARLHIALQGMQHPGLHVTVWDPDYVSEPNIGRTVFGPSDLFHSKSETITTRVNVTYGLMWRSQPEAYQHPYWHVERRGAPPDVVITAVDRLRPRADLYRQMLHSNAAPPRYWMDLGNGEETGQVILGEPDWLGDLLEGCTNPGRKERLRTVVDLFPDMLERAELEEDEPDSCSLAGALARQALPINRHMATWGFELLWRLFRDGGLDYHGCFVNARTGRVNPLPIATAAKVQERPPTPLAAATKLRRRLRSSGGVRPGRQLERRRAA